MATQHTADRDDAGRRKAKRRFTILALLIGGAAVWAVVTCVVVPSVIRHAYRGESLAFLNAMFEGRESHPVEEYLASWWPVARQATLWLIAAVVLLTVVVLLTRLALRPAVRESILEWCFREPAFSIRRDFALVAWLGVVLGILEFVGWRVRYAVDNEFLMWSDPDTIWMAPMAGMVGMVLLFLPLVLLSRLSARRLSVQALLFLLLSLGLFGLLRSMRMGIAAAALVVFAMGLGAAASRFLDARAERFRRIARWTTVPALALCALVGVGMHGAGLLNEREAMRRLPAAAAGARNVVLIILDTVRAQSLGLYGYSGATSPRLERFASRGLVFDDAFAPSSWTLPTHATMFTGRGPLEHGVDWTVPLDDTYPTIAEYLASKGYATGGFIANLSYATRESGLARGFTHYEDYPVSLSTVLSTTWWTRTIGSLWPNLWAGDYGLVRKWAPELNAAALRWLDRVDNRPFFVFINYYEGHAPYRPFPEFAPRSSAMPDSVPGRHGGWVAQTPEMREEMARYESSIAFLDEQLGRLLDSLTTRGLMDNTVVIITSDHGEQFGSHGWTGHGNALYTPVLQVPLVIVSPGLRAGRVQGAVGLRHIPATITTELGLEAGAPFPGHSLTHTEPVGAGMLAAEPDTILSHFVPRGRPQVVSMVADDLHYIRHGDGRERLFRLSTDPWETINLADSPGYSRALAGLRESVNTVLATEGSNTLPTALSRR